ncbi:MAG TPA: hypothetical protein VEX43_06920 [Chthoniobacterales bacterium]|nr:hypothetical protein [Chthoniobacterales bacterium]
MHSKFIRLALLCGFSLLLVHSAIAQIIPAPATPPPIVDPGAIIGPTPNPTMPPITPPPAPTVPPTPGPTAMPELPPTPPPLPTTPPSPPPVSTPTVPPINPPPVSTPTIPPTPPPPPLATPTITPIKPTPTVAPSPTIPPTPGPTAMPELPPTPPPLPTTPPSPPPVVTPTVPPAPTIPPAPTVPPLSSPPAIPVPSLDRADPQKAIAVIRYGPGYTFALAPRNSQGRFQKIALQPGQTITVLVNLSPADIGRPANLQILDGGAVGGIEVPEAGFPDIPGMPAWPDIPIEEIIGPVIDPNTVIDTGQTLPVSPTGQLAFGFRVGADVGLHRVSIIVGGNQYFFQFWRQDPSALNNNPGMLRAY